VRFFRLRGSCGADRARVGAVHRFHGKIPLGTSERKGAKGYTALSLIDTV